jgi:hypothetical protein
VGMPSKLHIEILWTHVGNVKNPQAKILRWAWTEMIVALLDPISPIIQCKENIRRRQIAAAHAHAEWEAAIFIHHNSILDLRAS